MVFHRRNDGSFRKLQEFSVKFAAQSCRIFHKEHDFFQEVFIHDDGAAFFVSQFLHALKNHLFAFFRIDDEEVFSCYAFIVFHRRDFKITGSQETMAAADAP